MEVFEALMEDSRKCRNRASSEISQVKIRQLSSKFIYKNVNNDILDEINLPVDEVKLPVDKIIPKRRGSVASIETADTKAENFDFLVEEERIYKMEHEEFEKEKEDLLSTIQQLNDKLTLKDLEITRLSNALKDAEAKCSRLEDHFLPAYQHLLSQIDILKHQLKDTVQMEAVENVIHGWLARERKPIPIPPPLSPRKMSNNMTENGWHIGTTPNEELEDEVVESNSTKREKVD